MQSKIKCTNQLSWILKVKGLVHFETSISVPYFDKRSLKPWQMKNISKYSSRV